MNRIFIFCLSVALSLSAMAQEASWKQAAAQMKAKNYSAALENLNEQLKTTQDVLVLRLKGMCLIELNRASEAIPVLEQALKIDPKNTASRFYLARAEAEAGNLQRAISLMQQIQREEPSSAYAAQAQKLLPSIQNLNTSTATAGAATNPNRRWHFQVGLIGEYDDNVANRSATTVTITEPMRGFRLVTPASADVHVLDEVIDKAPVTIGVTYDFYNSLHNDDPADDFNYMNHTGGIYVAKHGRVADMPADARIGGSFSADWLGGKKLSEHPDLNLCVGIKYLSWTYLSVFGHFQWIDYKNQPAPFELNARDGDNQSAGVSHSFYFFDDKWIVSVDYSHTWYNTIGSLYTSDGNSAGINSQVALPWWKMTWNAGFRYIQDDYNDYTPAPTRADNSYMLTTGLIYPLSIPGLDTELKYARIMTDSNKDFGNYDRNIITLGVRYTY